MQVLADTPTAWLTARASVMGRSHVSHNIPCQDDNDWFPLASNSAWGVAVVSDGAGSCANSHVGSQQIVKLAGWQFTQLIEKHGWADGKPMPDAQAWRTMSRLAFQEIAAQLRNYAEVNEIEFRSLSATVIVVVFSPDALLLAHIGDGRAAGQTENGNWVPLLTPYRGAEANSTVFLTSRSWSSVEDEKRMGSDVFLQPFQAFALLTDGCEMTTFSLSRKDSSGFYESINEPFAPVLDNVVTQIKTFYQQGLSTDNINALWAGYLSAGTERLANEPDDKTMLLAVRRKQEEGEVVISPPVPAAVEADNPSVRAIVPKVGKAKPSRPAVVHQPARKQAKKIKVKRRSGRAS
jgi:hypothetical protein